MRIFKNPKIYLLSLLICFALTNFGWRNADEKPLEVADFTLKNVDGKYISLANYPNSEGFMVVFVCNHCPMAKLYYNKLNTLATYYQAKGYPLIAINPMDSLLYEEETWEQMGKLSKAKKMVYPYLQDPTQAFAKSLGVTHTPQAYVLTKGSNNNYKVVYNGAIDNGESDDILKSYLAKTVNLLIANKPITEPKHTAIGCAVYYRK